MRHIYCLTPFSGGGFPYLSDGGNGNTNSGGNGNSGGQGQGGSAVQLPPGHSSSAQSYDAQGGSVYYSDPN